MAANYNFNVNVLCANPVSITETGEAIPIRIAPNPAGENVRISGLRGNATIRLYNSSGQLCMQQISRSEEQWIALTPFAEGLYFVVIDNGQNRITQKVIIQR